MHIAASLKTDPAPRERHGARVPRPTGVQHLDPGRFQRLALRCVGALVSHDDRPACPIFFPGGDAPPAMKATTGLRMSRTYSAVSSSIVPPISPTTTTASVRSSASRACTASRVVVPRIGSPPIPTKADSPKPACTRFRQISVPRLPLRDTTPTLPGRKTSRSNAGMKPTKHSPGVTRPAVLGPATAAPFARAAASTSITSCTGTCSVRTTSRGQPPRWRRGPPPSPPAGG